MPPLLFAADFPAADYAQWRALAEKSLAGGDFDTRLVSRTTDGLAIQPLYSKALNPPALLLNPDAGPPLVMQRVDHPDAAAANTLALLDLDNGAGGLVLLDAAAATARGFGLPIAGALRQVLRDVPLECVTLRLDAGPASATAAQALHYFALQRGVSVLNADFGIDPAGVQARTGNAPLDKTLFEIAAFLAAHWRGSHILMADGRLYHEAGASEAQELAAVIATALFYLRALEGQGLELDAARRSIAFLLAADSDIFLNLAKFRALRFLWARIEQACGLEPLPIRLHAETSWRMLTRRAPHLNMVRGTIATFAAGLGGADTITVLPYTLALGLPDAAARRAARNIQTILQAEAHIARVADAAAGSGAVEQLTQDLAALAWQKFQAIEAAGGMVETLKSGSLQRDIAASHQSRGKDMEAGFDTAETAP